MYTPGAPYVAATAASFVVPFYFGQVCIALVSSPGSSSVVYDSP